MQMFNYKNPLFYVFAPGIIIILIMIYKFWGISPDVIRANNEILISYWKNLTGISYFFAFFVFFVILVPVLLISDAENYKNGLKKFFLYLFLYIIFINLTYFFAEWLYWAMDYYLLISK